MPDLTVQRSVAIRKLVDTRANFHHAASEASRQRLGLALHAGRAVARLSPRLAWTGLLTNPRAALSHVELARQARALLDDAGLRDVQIFVSGGLDEDAIACALASAAPIDAFGVGTRMGVSSDHPDLDIAYKLCEYDAKGRLKLSTGKAILPGRKQVFRFEVGVSRYAT